MIEVCNAATCGEADVVLIQDLKPLVECIHRQYYGHDLTNNADQYIIFHEHLSQLFNLVGITSTLVENNPNEVSPEQFKNIFTGEVYER